MQALMLNYKCTLPGLIYNYCIAILCMTCLLWIIMCRLGYVMGDPPSLFQLSLIPMVDAEKTFKVC